MDKQQEETRPEEVIAGSAYFDGKWYAEKYHITQEDPAAHYLERGVEVWALIPQRGSPRRNICAGAVTSLRQK